MKKHLLIILSVFILTIAVNAQPYIYYLHKSQLFNPNLDTLSNVYNIQSYNIRTDEVKDFSSLKLDENCFNVYFDHSETFLIWGYAFRREVAYFLFNSSDTSDFMKALDDFQDIDEGLFSKKRNILYLFADDYSKIFRIDVKSWKIISSLSIDNDATSYNNLIRPSYNSFFSSDQNKIYFYSQKSYNDPQMISTYSLISNSIVESKELSKFGHPDVDGYAIMFGRKGKGLLESYNNENEFSSYYSIYNFDNDSSSAFIKFDGRFSEAYFDNGGKYLLVFNTFYDTTNNDYYHTGKVQIYNSEDGKLINNLSLPEQGIIYTFDSYPDDLYYVVDIDSPKKQIFHIDADSLLNR
jgi:hypothetical protein